MKKSITLGLALVAVMAGSLIPNSNVLAANAIHSGAICHNYDKGQANDPDFYPNGVKNSATASRKVICPLVVTHVLVQEDNGQYENFGIELFFNTPTAFSCTLYSYDSFDDRFLGSKTATTGTGVGSVFIGYVPANYGSNHNVVCTLPANQKGRIISIDAQPAA
jgi:hypothetical protein